MLLIFVNGELWVSIYSDLFLPSPWMVVRRHGIATAGNAVLCLSLIVTALLTGGSCDVRQSPYYVTVYALRGAMGLAAGLRLFSLLGISLRDDVIERRNHSAFWALNGALIGLSACYAGSNIGNGPGPNAVVFCAILGSISFLLVWFAVDVLASHWVDAVTIDRDYGSGVRLGAVLLAIGLAAGSALTGDRVSHTATLRDFVGRSWPIWPTLSLAVVAERRFRGLKNTLSAWGSATAIVTLAVICVAVERLSR